MTKIEKLFSKDRKSFIEVVYEHEANCYLIHRHAIKYDCEEDIYYEVRVLPNPSCRFADPEQAIEEAKRILGC